MQSKSYEALKAQEARAKAELLQMEADGYEAFDMSAYAHDDYPREGCQLAIDVGEHGYGLRVYAPNGVCLEIYGSVAQPAVIGRMVREWCEGKAPRLVAPEDYAGSPGSSVTS